MSEFESSKKRLRVVLIADWFFYYVAALANALADASEVLVVTRDHGHEIGIEGDATQAKRAMLDPRVRLWTVSGKQSNIFSLRSALRATSAVRGFQADVVHAQAHGDWRLLITFRLARARASIVTIHDVVTHPGSQRRPPAIKRFVVRSMFRAPHAYIVHGQQLAQMLRERPWYEPQRQVFVIPHGVLAQPAEASALPDTPTVLMFGRLEYYKGLDVLVRAAEIAARELVDLKVIVAGSGPEVASCKELVTRPEIFDWRVGFVRDDEIPCLFAASTVVVLPYRQASQSGVVPLAFQNGRSVICTRVGSLAEAVDDGEDGLIVPPEDPDSLARAIVRFHREPGLAKRLSAHALAAATRGRLSPAAIAAQHEAVYETVLSDHHERD